MQIFLSIDEHNEKKYEEKSLYKIFSGYRKIKKKKRSHIYTNISQCAYESIK